ncbi:NAD-dependent epimerase/dehydratase family protein [Actinoplanes sp. TFC3]|uniref:NAD-dependent epimerase/dehydratase family protein n=1 Tax=Actinoplanes sp. TFC3 TaxID=1710355 RepID=UPI0008362691|nr:NAD-dependent epimerase/dehydratase family protein [Actinoplanes sp. TFC3]
MKIAVTGGSGYIGAALVAELVKAGHHVTALVRNAGAAGKVSRLGAEAAVGDLFEPGWVAARFAETDAVAHLAATGNPSTQQLDRGIVEAAKQAGKPYVHTSGIWLWGDNAAITEESPIQPPALTQWRVPVEEAVLTSGLVVTIIAPAVVYGHGGGSVVTAFTAGRTVEGKLPLAGDGSQHWSTVHVDDIARLYRLVLERGEGLGYLIGACGDNPVVRDLGAACAGPAGIAEQSVAATRERFGTPFADALLLDQQATGAKARGLGWQPSGPSLAEELRAGKY